MTHRWNAVLVSCLLFVSYPLVATDDPAGDHGPQNARLYYLDISPGKGRLLTANPDGTDVKVLVPGLNMGPDGVAVDSAHGYVYWTNMGKASVNDGSVQRANLDGTNVVTIVPEGGTFTAKQLKIDKKHGKLYWSDREGMRVMRANLDGSQLETLVQ